MRLFLYLISGAAAGAAGTYLFLKSKIKKMEGLLLELSTKLDAAIASAEAEKIQHAAALAAKDAVIAEKNTVIAQQAESITALENQLANSGTQEDLQALINKAEDLDVKVKDIVPE